MLPNTKQRQKNCQLLGRWIARLWKGKNYDVTLLLLIAWTARHNKSFVAICFHVACSIKTQASANKKKNMINRRTQKTNDVPSRLEKRKKTNRNAPRLLTTPKGIWIMCANKSIWISNAAISVCCVMAMSWRLKIRRIHWRMSHLIQTEPRITGDTWVIQGFGWGAFLNDSTNLRCLSSICKLTHSTPDIAVFNHLQGEEERKNAIRRSAWNVSYVRCVWT